MPVEEVPMPARGTKGIVGLDKEGANDIERNTYAVTRRFIELFEAKEVSKAYAMIGYRGRFILIGNTPVSGVFVGWHQFMERMGGVWKDLHSPSTTRFSEVIVDGDRVVMLASGEGYALEGRQYTQPYYAFVARVEGDGLAELIEFCDTVMIEQAYFGKKLVPMGTN